MDENFFFGVVRRLIAENLLAEDAEELALKIVDGPTINVWQASLNRDSVNRQMIFRSLEKAENYIRMWFQREGITVWSVYKPAGMVDVPVTIYTGGDFRWQIMPYYI